MKRKIRGAAIAFGIIVAMLWFLTSNKPAPKPLPEDSVNGQKLAAAVHSYTRDLKTRGAPLPSSVSLRELIMRRYISRGDVRGFDGIEVSFPIESGEPVNELSPQNVLARARLPNGEEVVALGDGSVQTPRAHSRKQSLDRSHD